MNSQLVPVDGKGLDWPRKVANAINAVRQAVADFLARLSTVETDIVDLDTRTTAVEALATGYGWADYTDNDVGTVISLTAGTRVQVMRSLASTAPNYRLRGPWADHTFWDDTTSLITPRALYDVLYMSIYMRIAPGALGGTLTVTLMAGAVDVGTKTFSMTSAAGTDMGLRADFMVPVRSGFMTNGAKVMLTSDVAADLKEFSPEFYPLSFEP